ncbi:MAG TPA: ABC transporter ATP-binding protein [Anaerolineaceae bacterium]|nr:ABC transporter ATP-binding protein [Anaerolineaceae bacterium]
MIQCERVTFAYPQRPPVFEDFDWRAERGDAWAVIGPSGCGKSTLLSLLAGLRFPNQGRVCVDGEELKRPRPFTGLIIQDYGLLPWATVRQNAELGLHLRDFYGADGVHAPREARRAGAESATAWLERLGLSGLEDQYPSQLSGGQRQRTAIARTLALNPDLLLMDEPFSSLDAPTRDGLQALILDLWAEKNLTLVIVTHTIEEAAILGRKILLLKTPPNREAVIMENPWAGAPGYRDSSEYLALCRELRSRLEQA